MSSAPPPPSPPPAAPAGRRAPAVGTLTRPWRAATVVAWVLVCLAFSAIIKAAVQLGIGTWWVGTHRPISLALIPFLAPTAMVLAALANARRLPWFGGAAALVTALIGVLDFGTLPRYGLLEVALGAAMVLFSLASTAGRWRRVPPPAAATGEA